MKAQTKRAIEQKSFCHITTKPINEYMFSSWRMNDEKGRVHYYLIPGTTNPNIPKFGFNPDHYEIDYMLLGQLDMVRQC